jgi:hypothetical protein
MAKKLNGAAKWIGLGIVVVSAIVTISGVNARQGVYIEENSRHIETLIECDTSQTIRIKAIEDAQLVDSIHTQYLKESLRRIEKKLGTLPPIDSLKGKDER